MSVVNYNGVTLPYSKHTQFRQEAIRDDSGTDRCYTKFDLEIMTIIHADYLAALAPDLMNPDGSPSLTDAATIMVAVRQRLLVDRKQLSVKCNGKELIPLIQEGNAGTVDAKNGPQPQYCVVTQLNNATFLMTFRIIAHYWENYVFGQFDINLPGNAVLYNRWEESVEIDQCLYTTRTREGKFAIRSDNALGAIADMLRDQMAVVGVPVGFRRLSSNYSVSADGLTLSYRIVDRELYNNLPTPAYKAQGRYTESAAQFGVMHYGDVYVRLESRKDVPRHLLIESAVQICAAKLQLPGATLNGQRLKPAILESMSVTIDLYENIVECQAKAMMQTMAPGGIARIQGQWGFDYAALGFTPYPDGQNNAPAGGAVQPPPWTKDSPLWPAGGTANFLLKAAAYYDPSLPETELDPAKGQLNAGEQVGVVGAGGE